MTTPQEQFTKLMDKIESGEITVAELEALVTQP